MRSVPLVAFLLMLTPLSCLAQAPQAEGGEGPWSFGFGLGGFDAQDGTGTLQNQSGQYSLMFDATYRYTEYASFEFDVFGTEQRFDTPPGVYAILGTVDGRSTIFVGGVNAVAKFGIPMGGVEPYVGAGIGLYFSSLLVTGSLLGAAAEAEEEDWGLGQQLLAGLNFRVSERWWLGVEYRRTFLEANFGLLGGGEVDIGGDSIMATVRLGSPGQAR